MNRAISLACTGLLFAALAGAVAAQQKAAPAAADAKRERTLPVGTRAWKGDLDEMTTKRHLIRALVPFSKTFYYVERGRPRGISYELLQQFEQELNKKLKTKNLKVRVVFLPVGREELIQRLVEGYGDVIVADLVVTPERQKTVDFSDPLYSGIKEIVVTGPGGPEISTLDDLAGKEVFVRKTSSYYEHLQGLNRRFASERKPAVKIRVADEDLEAEDILEMVNAGLIGATVVDRYKAIMWARVFTNLGLRSDAVLADGGENAFVIRKDSPQLKAALNAFVKQYGQGTTFGNSIVNRYVKDPKFVKNALGSDEVRRFGEVVGFFRKYGDKYDVDHLLMIAQGFQESGLDQNAKSAVGAIGIMQIMPATGKELKVGDITQVEANIHGGVKYVRFMIDQYYANEPMTPLNKGLFAFASYNAGPGRVAGLRKEAAKRGLDPNRWFHNVELVAAEKIGSETVTYVSNIYKYYTAYKLLEEQEASRQAARAQAGADKARASKAAK
ncbi:MAG TPA: lytic transglycosylase F [Burkholderiales bacterium]|nr:lytic transglycosylase F [Burkholderiales bacterium]